jgi:hypothetical protein
MALASKNTIDESQVKQSSRFNGIEIELDLETQSELSPFDQSRVGRLRRANAVRLFAAVVGMR